MGFGLNSPSAWCEEDPEMGYISKAKKRFLSLSSSTSSTTFV
jgi:hypothetical protein